MVKRMLALRLLLAVPLLAAGLALGAPRPVSAAYECSQNEVISGTLKSSLVVPPDTTCSLGSLAVVRGSVTISAGATFSAGGTVEIRGAVTGTGINSLQLTGTGTQIRGDLTIIGSGFVYLQEVSVRGDVTITGATVNPGSLLQYSTVRGGVTVTDNAFIQVSLNTIGTDLFCDNNANLVAFSNNVGGQKLEDCAGTT